MHASLSCYDLHNTLIAAGPGFKRGWVDEFPSGNTDVAPTVLSILGIARAQPMQGRVLAEAFDGTAATIVPTPAVQSIKASRKLGIGTWNQYLNVIKIGEAVYVEEGNGALSKENQ